MTVTSCCLNTFTLNSSYNLLTKHLITGPLGNSLLCFLFSPSSPVLRPGKKHCKSYYCPPKNTMQWPLASQDWTSALITYIVFTWRHQIPKSKAKKLPKVFILIRHKGSFIYICLQLFSLIACLVWKPGWRILNIRVMAVCDMKLWRHLSKIFTYLMISSQFRIWAPDLNN